MKSFKQYLEEIYKPIAKDAIKWDTSHDTMYTKHTTSTVTPGGHNIEVNVLNWHGYPGEEKRHDFGFKRDDNASRKDDEGDPENNLSGLAPADFHHAHKFIKDTLNHYAQHMLPRGHKLDAQPYAHAQKELDQKGRIYSKAFQSFAKQSGGKFKFSTKFNPRPEWSGDHLYLTKVSEAIIPRFRDWKKRNMVSKEDDINDIASITGLSPETVGRVSKHVSKVGKALGSAVGARKHTLKKQLLSYGKELERRGADSKQIGPTSRALRRIK